MERAVLLRDNGALDESDFATDSHAADSAAVAGSGTLSDLIRSAVVRALDAQGGNKSAAARRLGISRTRLQRILDGEPDGEGPRERAGGVGEDEA